MPIFAYRAKAGPAQVTEGVIEAENRRAALDKISGLGVFPLSVEEKAAKTLPSSFGSVSVKQVAAFARQLADLLDSGVPLLRALQIARRQVGKGRMALVVADVTAAVEGGKTLSSALEKHPDTFLPLHVGLVRAGEVSGLPGVALGRLADLLEREEELRAKVRDALAYPTLIAATGLGTVLFLLLFVVPKLAGMFAETGQGLPLATRVLAGFSAVLHEHFAPVSVFVLVGGGASIHFLKTRLPVWWGQVSPHLPIWGAVERKVSAARFARTLATLLSGGVPLEEALDMTAAVLSAGLGRQVLEASARVREGASLSQALAGVAGLPDLVSHMASIGEEANILEKSLEKAAVSFEREADRALKLAISLLEPLMILLVGGVIGGIVLSLLLPIFQISAFIR